MSTAKKLSPSRRYVAICNNSNFDGFYLKSFEIPLEEKPDVSPSWYFLNVLNFQACLESIITREEYDSMTPQATAAEREAEIQKMLTEIGIK